MRMVVDMSLRSMSSAFSTFSSQLVITTVAYIT
jgi:hypothetical protein